MKEIMFSVLLLLVTTQSVLSDHGQGRPINNGPDRHPYPGPQQYHPIQKDFGGNVQQQQQPQLKQQEQKAPSGGYENSSSEFKVGYGGTYIRKSKEEQDNGDYRKVKHNPIFVESNDYNQYKPNQFQYQDTFSSVSSYSHPGNSFKQQLNSEAVVNKQLLNEGFSDKQRLNEEILDRQQINKALLEKQRLTAALEKQKLNYEILERQRLNGALLDKQRLDTEILDKQRYNAGILTKQLSNEAHYNKQILNAAILDKERLSPEIFEKQRFNTDIQEKQRQNAVLLEKKLHSAALLEKQRFNSAILDKQIGKSLESLRATQDLSLLVRDKLLESLLSRQNSNGAKPLADFYGAIDGLQRPLGLGPTSESIFKTAGPPYGKSLDGDYGRPLEPLYGRPVEPLYGKPDILLKEPSIAKPSYNGDILVKEPINPPPQDGSLGVGYYDYEPLFAPIPQAQQTVTVITPIYNQPRPYDKAPLQTVVHKDNPPHVIEEHIYPQKGYPALVGQPGPYSQKPIVKPSALPPPPPYYGQGPVDFGPFPERINGPGKIVNVSPSNGYGYSYKLLPESVQNHRQPHVQNNQQPYVQHNQQQYNNYGPIDTLDNVDQYVSSKALDNAQFLINKELEFGHNNQQPYVQNNQQPYVQNNQQPYVQNNQQPYVKNNQQPYVQSNQQPYVQSNQQPYVQSNQQPYVQNNQQPYVQHNQQPYNNYGPIDTLDNVDQYVSSKALDNVQFLINKELEFGYHN